MADTKKKAIVGSVVRLNSGSPGMTVLRVDHTGGVDHLEVSYLDRDGKVARFGAPAACFIVDDRLARMVAEELAELEQPAAPAAEPTKPAAEASSTSSSTPAAQ